MTTQSRPRSERIRALALLRDRAAAELTGIENGSLLVLEERGRCTPADVADALGVSRQGANNYLNALWKAGLAERERLTMVQGGRSFVYWAPHREDNPLFRCLPLSVNG